MEFKLHNMYSTRKLQETLLFISIFILLLMTAGCVKDPVLPSLTTGDVENIGATSATVSGKVTDDGGAAVTSRGICWGTESEPTLDDNFRSSGTGKGEFSCDIEGLQPNTVYHARAFAENSVGIAYGNEIVFTSGIAAPSVATGRITAITNTTAICSGTVTYDGGSPDTERGICWSTSPEPDLGGSFATAGTGANSYSVNVTNLQQGTRYYVRAYVKNAGGTVYGEQVIFNTKVADIEGNLYGTINIGTQVWMTENLRTTRYNDNTPIPNVTGDSEWIAQTTPAYCWLRNEIQYKEIYGALYNWFTVETGKLCPAGWHVPSDSEYKKLEQTLGMPASELDNLDWRGSDQGSKMKSQTGWAPGENGTNSSGFSALPGGYRFARTGAFNGIGINTYWWSSELNEEYGWYRFLEGTSSGVYRSGTSKTGGKYIRCVKD